MTKEELITKLLNLPCPPDTKVVVETGGYNYKYTGSSVTVEGFDGDSIYITELTPEDVEEGYTEEDVMSPEDEIVVVIW